MDARRTGANATHPMIGLFSSSFVCVCVVAQAISANVAASSASLVRVLVLGGSMRSASLFQPALSGRPYLTQIRPQKRLLLDLRGLR